MRLKGRVAIVTGGGSGIGSATAQLFAREGASVVVAGRRAKPLDETVTAIRDVGGQAFAVTTDVTSAGEVEALTEAVVSMCGRIDVLVNNAGAVISRTGVTECSEFDWAATLAVNLGGPYLCAKAMMAELVRARGNIVQVASVFALVGMPNSAAYTGAKGALVSLTRAMATEVGPLGVRVNAICPAYVETDMNRAILDGLRAAGTFDSVTQRLPLGRLGAPMDVAYAALYLASEEARWVTGVVLPVDGGMSASRY